jgi:ribosomal protein L11 methylase PrmA
LKTNHKSSFRDNSGYIYQKDRIYYRSINLLYKANYNFLISSGLYQRLVKDFSLISHKEIQPNVIHSEGHYKTLLPEQLPFISFPYCWSFGMLKDAALLTLRIQKESLKYGMILKDASAFNIQFRGHSPIFIDTLSFEEYTDGTPWLAYNQFCQHFLAPLALMSYTDITLNQLLISNIDGLSLELTTKLLPFKSKFNFGLYLHIFMHSKAQKNYKAQKGKNSLIVSKINYTAKSIERIVDSLISTIEGLTLSKQNTTWDSYYEKWVIDQYFDKKVTTVKGFIETIGTGLIQCLDLGANDGTFSFLAAKHYNQVLSFDIDPLCVEQNYQALKKEKITNILPLIIDFTNPAPAIGWNNEERESILKQIGKVDTIMALAVIHHLCIGKNIPLQYLVDFLKNHCNNLIIEFVPKTDEKVKLLLENREDIFPLYNVNDFKKIFSEYFDILEEIILTPTDRILFLMKLKAKVTNENY